MMYLIRIAHVADWRESVLKDADVLIDGMAGALTQLAELLSREHRCVHRTEPSMQARHEVAPRRARRLVLPPVHRRTGEVR